MSEAGRDELAGEGPGANHPRIGSRDAISIGLPRDGWRDAYHILLTMPLPAFFATMAGAYLTINSIFALLYMVDPGAVISARPGSFTDHFFFSVQTLGSIGYGVMSPRGFYANAIVTLESFVGLFNLAIATGLLFARISRPTARIMFSKIASVAPFEGVQALTFRAANRRRNLVIEAEVSLTMVRDVVTREGTIMRRFFDLPVVRSRSPLFSLTWQIMHLIDEASPLWGETHESLIAKRAQVLAVIKGLDETFVTTIHARTSYSPDMIVWGRRLVDIFTVDAAGRTMVDYGRFHDAA